MARYSTRVTVAMGALRDRSEGPIEIETLPDPHTGARVKVLDRLDFIHAVCQQIPDAKLHQVRHDGAYSCRKRRALRELALSEASASQGALAGVGGDEEKGGADGEPAIPSTDRPPPATPGSAEARRRSSWARMLRKVSEEVDPLVCNPTRTWGGEICSAGVLRPFPARPEGATLPPGGPHPGPRGDLGLGKEAQGCA